MPSLSNAVEINGFLIRELRKRQDMSVVELAAAIGCQRPYVAKIELGHSRRVSVKVFNALLATFGIEDRRALLANPYGEALEEVS